MPNFTPTEIQWITEIFHAVKLAGVIILVFFLGLYLLSNRK